MCGAKSSTASRVGYALVFLVTAVLCILAYTNQFHLVCKDEVCAGVLGVYRVCFASSLLHLGMAVGMHGVSSSSDWRAGVQNGYWGLKVGAYAALLGLAVWLPNDFYRALGVYVDMPGAALFIFIQMLLLIDFAYSASEKLLGLF